jgi:hypothetical protein
MAAKKKSSPVMEFVTDYLKRKRGASFAEIRDAAAKKRLKVYPIVYGRAQALLGIVKSAPRGSGKAARAKAAKAAGRPAGRGRGRPRASAAAPMESRQGIIAAVEECQAAKERYRSVLARIQTLLQDAMA